MALSLPQGSTVKVEVQSGGSNTTIDLTNILGSVSPALTIPSVLDMIRNTTVKPADSMTGNTLYYAAFKPEPIQTIKTDSNGRNVFTAAVANRGGDPRAMASREVSGIVERHSASQFADKLHDLNFDLNAANGRALFAQQVGTWIDVRRTAKCISVLEELTTKVSAITITGTPTTFDKGAHVQTGDGASGSIDTAEKAYDAYRQAISKFQRIGLPNAPAAENKAYKHANGIRKGDMIALMTPEFESLILGKQGVFASIPGNADFKNAGIKSILGVYTTTTVELPENVDFMILTTGANGTVGHQLIGDGIASKVVVDPNWSFALRADMVDNFTIGVVLPFQAFILKNA